MNRLTRLTAILTHLQSKRTITAKEIAEKFEISIRTVYRDIRTLESSGIPLGAEAGKGYFIVDGYHLPPVMFSEREAGALLIGSKLIENLSDPSITEFFDSAMLKIRAVLNYKDKEHVENLDNQIKVISSIKPSQSSFPNNFLSEIQLAIACKTLLKLEYFSNYRGSLHARVIEPSGLCYYGNHWHLIAYCRLREGYRDFRTDRIKSLEPLNEKYTEDRSDEFQNFVNNITDASELTKIKVTLPSKLSRFIGDEKYHFGFISEETQNDLSIMTFMYSDLKFFAKWILMFGDQIKIISPAQLKGNVKQLVNELVDFYARE